MYKQYMCYYGHSQSERVAEAVRLIGAEGYRLVSVTTMGQEMTFHFWKDITE